MPLLLKQSYKQTQLFSHIGIIQERNEYNTPVRGKSQWEKSGGNVVGENVRVECSGRNVIISEETTYSVFYPRLIQSLCRDLEQVFTLNWSAIQQCNCICSADM